jgi:hypothetical protein
VRRATTIAAVAALAIVGGVPAQATVADRSFSVTAASFPVEPAPGLNQTELGIRPAAVRASLSNPPATAYGRSAAYDLGTIELYTGPPPPESVAECDTGSPNIPDSATAAPGDLQLAAACTEKPSVDASATGRSFESSGLIVKDLTSHVTADGGGDALVSEATSSVHDISMGPLVVASVSTRASAKADGTPGGAAATGRVVATGATVNGTPVVIGADGIEVDTQKVPLEFVGAATAAVREALAQGGYSDVRVVQPATEASPDGLHAAVRGGGLSLYFTNNDPQENYFIRVTFGGVNLAVDLGPQIGTGEVPAPAAPAAGDAGVLGNASPTPAQAAGITTSDASAPLGTAEPILTSGRRTYDLPSPWRGWPVLLAVGGAAAVAAWLTRRRLVGWWTVNADRYLRG